MESMNSLEIEFFLCDLDSFLGVFSIDTAPTTFSKYPSCYVTNNEPSYMSGQHWISVYAISPDLVIFFDSFGFPASYYGLSFNCRTLFWPYAVQDPRDMTCGLHTIYFLTCMHYKKNLDYTIIYNKIKN